MLVPDLKLPPADDGESVQIFGKIAPLTTAEFEPVGRWYEAYSLRRTRTASHTSLISSSSEEEEEEDEAIDEEEEARFLKTLDPKNWKKQDHYAVLGIEKIRCIATDDQVKKAYKQKVLRHHPDKRSARGMPAKEAEEDYFTCITRAYETLGTTVKRRAYDSVDPNFDDDIPSNSADSKQQFFDVFGPVFERNSRWSLKRNVPQLGDDKTNFDDVEKFYAFWFSFESWREYSYLDEEEKDKGENRDERRWMDKQNKAARQKLKKEEVARIRQLVENAYACDPRIIRHMTEAKEKKASEKKAKQDAIRHKIEEEERRKQKELDEEREKKEKIEGENKAQAAILKKEKEAQKKIIKKERRLFRDTMKELDYMSTSGAERVQVMQDVDRLAESLSVLSLQSLNEALTSDDKAKANELFRQHVQGTQVSTVQNNVPKFTKTIKFARIKRCTPEDKARASQVFIQEVKEMNLQSEREMQQLLETTSKQGSGGGEKVKSKDNWTEAELQMLIKAVNLFPAGTNNRWETINNFLQMHVAESKRSVKEVLAKAKDLHKNDTSLKEEANKKAFEKFSKSQGGATAEAAEASERYDTAAETQVYEVGSNPAPWTADEQKILEQSMRTFPATLADRWDKIAESIPMRSKKDCMKRYKELVELIRVKKLAQATATKKK